MVIRIGGLASGMDIDALVEKLMQAERSPLNKLQQKKTTYEWQRDAYRGVNTKLKTFDTYIADNLVLKSLNTKTASSSNSDLVSATATGSATGNLSIEGVSKLAKAARTVSTEQINATSNTKLSDLGFTGTSFSIKAIQSNGEMAKEATEITYDGNTTIGQLISKINSSNAGVSAVFENGRLSVTAKNTGENKAGDAEIQITSGVGDFKKLGFSQLNATGDLATDGSNAQFIVNGIATERSSNTFSINGYNVTLKKTFNEGAANSSFSQAADQNVQYAKTNLRNFLLQSASKYNVDFSSTTSLSAQYNLIKGELESKISTATDTVNTKTTNLNDAKNVRSNAYNGLSSEEKDFLNSLSDSQRIQLANKDSLDDVSDLNLTGDQQAKLDLVADKSALAALTESDVKTAGQQYDGLSSRAKEILANLNSIDDIPSTIPAEDAEAFAQISALGSNFAAVKGVSTATAELKEANDTLTSLKADEASNKNLYQTYQNALYTQAEAQNQPPTTLTTSAVMLSSTNNVDDTINKIKDFINTYNGLVKELTAQTKETKYRDYAPLTAEQRKEMEESEIKLWEEKAKSGLLRGDSLIANGLSNMRSLIYQSNPAVADSRYNTLYSIGITTSKNYNEGGTLEIDEAKLRKALEENPDAVDQLFRNSGKKDDIVDGHKADTRGYLDKLRESLKNFEISIEKKAGRSTMTDAQYTIGKNLMDTETRIKSWQDKLKNIEARYWKQFTAMESAINKANQQSSMFFSGQ